MISLRSLKEIYNLCRLVTVSKAVIMYNLVTVPELLLKLVLFKMDDNFRHSDEAVHSNVKTNPLHTDILFVRPRVKAFRMSLKKFKIERLGL